MPDPTSPKIQSVLLSKLRPTQLTVGLLEVKQKRKRVRLLEKRPTELVAFILENPIRVVFGPAEKAYVIDHHHLALALIKESFETAPMEIEDDFSALDLPAFWEKMEQMQFVHPIDAHGIRKPVSALPKKLRRLEDDPYRSLACFVREAGGYLKSQTPFAEFQWADFFRSRITKKFLRNHFQKALTQALALAKGEDAAALPGCILPPPV